MKTIAKAAMIVGAVALVASGVGAIVGGAAFFAATGVTLATVSAIATVAAIVGTVAGQFASKKPTVSGGATSFKADPQAGIPYMVGRTFHAGNIVHRDSWGEDNRYQAFVTVWSGGGPIESIESFLVDWEAVAFDGGGTATGSRFGFIAPDRGPWMHLTTQLGECPEAAALTPAIAGLPGWTGAHKLSGYAAGIWIVRFDKKGKKFAGGVPLPGIVAEGVKVYDPRLDSTYPGGSGACRALDESTYVYSANGYLHGLTFALGRWQNGQRVMGAGALPEQIDMDAFIDAANVSEANGWVIGGVVNSTDEKWPVIKSMLLPCGGEPMQNGARLSCFIHAPKVSIATIDEGDLVGDLQVVTTNPRRSRINAIIPRFRSEPHSWQIIPASAIIFEDLVTEDRGRRRTEELEIQLCQDLDQASQIGAYRVLNSREQGPITAILKPKWTGLRPGDCITVNWPSIDFVDQKLIVRRRKPNPEDGSVTLTFVTETDTKHALALGTAATAPPEQDFSIPEPSDSSVTDATLTSLLISTSFPIFTGNAAVGTDAGTTATITIETHDRSYTDKAVAVTGDDITGLVLATAYYIYYDDPTRVGGVVLFEATTDYSLALNSATNPGRHYVGYIITPADAAGDTYMVPSSPVTSYDPYDPYYGGDGGGGYTP